jgi:glycine hydroxymethyltransferase
MSKIKDIIEIVNCQNRWRREECINLIASESVMSPLAEKYYLSDFEGRYNEHDVEPHYCGTKFSMEIENLCNAIFQKNFNTSRIETRPISGAVANLAIYTAFTKVDDVFISLGIPNGAHVSSTKWGLAGIRGLKNIDMFFDKERMNIDVDETVKLINHLNVKFVMFGGSMFLFPEPIKEIREQFDSKVKFIYDAAHLFGLIYNHKFQDPLAEGVDIMTASTHKTFQGPQGGIIVGNPNLPEEDWEKVQAAIFPGILSNHHIHRLPALAITALEMNEFGEAYAKQVIKNAKKLGETLYNLGFKVLCPDLGFTESHQLIVNVKEFGGGKLVAEKLEECNIICNKMSIPTDSPHDATKNPSGIRLGTQELTRWGMKESEMTVVADFFKKALIEKRSADEIKKDTTEFKKDFNKISYCFAE